MRSNARGLSMMARNTKRSVQGPDTEAQDLSPPDYHFRLATRGRPIQKGHECECTVWKTGAIPACTLQHLPRDIFRTVARPAIGGVKFHNTNWFVVLAGKHI